MDSAKFLGEVAIAKGLATREQVLAALKEQYRLRCLEKRHLFLGEVLIQQGVMTLDQLAVLMELSAGYHEHPLEQRRKVFFGDIAVQKGYVSAVQLFRCLQRQRDEDTAGLPHRLIGEIMVDLGHLSAWELEDVVSTMVDLGYRDYSEPAPGVSAALVPGEGSQDGAPPSVALHEIN